MNTTLETKRLLLRPLKQSDAIDIFENWASDEDFPKYMTWSAHKNIEETKKIVDMWIKEYEDPKTIRFMIVLKSTNEVIGQINVVKIVDDIPEIGYLIMKKYWNNILSFKSKKRAFLLLDLVLYFLKSSFLKILAHTFLRSGHAVLFR